MRGPAQAVSEQQLRELYDLLKLGPTSGRNPRLTFEESLRFA
jgi:hypothetical protein